MRSGLAVLLALCAGLQAQQTTPASSAQENFPQKQSEVVRSLSTPADEPVQGHQRAIVQLRAITEAIRKCSANRTASDPMNVVWDIEERQSVRSPRIGFIEFTMGKGDPPVLPRDEGCRPKDKACQQRNLDTLGIWNVMFENWEAAKPMQYRFEFDFGSDGLEFARKLTKLEDADGSLWTAANFGNGCIADAVLTVVDDPMKSGRPRPPEVPPELWAAAQRGETAAIFNIGVLYSSGKGQLFQDYAESVRWYRKGAGQGDVSAQLALAYSYLNGKGIAQDAVAAVNWYRKAAEQGNPRGQVMLAALYGMGQGVSKDNEESYFWFCLAAPALDDDARKVRDEMAGTLTPTKRLEVQERCRKWLAEHPQTHQ